MAVRLNRIKSAPEMPTGTEVASFKKYEDATKAVELLGERDFPLDSVTVVGSGVHMVERVLGKLTPARVALTGATQGLTWGLIMGLFAMLFIREGAALIAMVALVVGVLAGVLMSVLSWGMNRNRRNFAARTSLVASRYAVLVDSEADRAYSLLAQAPGNMAAAPAPARAVRPSRGEHGTSQAGRQHSDAGAPFAPSAGAAPTEDRKPTEYGSRKDERPRFGVRLEDQAREHQEDQAQEDQVEQVRVEVAQERPEERPGESGGD